MGAMRALRSPPARSHAHRPLLAAASLLLIASLACTLPGIDLLFPPPQPEATPTLPGPTPTPMAPLPPTLVETAPFAGEELATGGDLTLYFDQPMDRQSVEAAFSMDPSVPGTFVWSDDATLTFTPGAALARDTSYRLTIGEGARSAAGLSPASPLEASFQTVGFLEVAQALPAPNSAEIAGDAAITLVFNRPVVPLEFEGPAPAPLMIDPPVPGTGEWIDTSIYVFRPEPAFAGGVSYSLELDSSLTAVDGAGLRDTFAWSFSTASPRLLEIEPADGILDAGLDPEIRLSFNQPMDQDAVEAAFSLDARGTTPVAGAFDWSDDGRELIFTPSDLLDYNTDYVVRVGGGAVDVGGSPLEEAVERRFRTVPTPSVIDSTPSNDGFMNPNLAVQIEFSGPMDPASLLQALSFDPPLERRSASWRSESRTLLIFGDYLPRTSYELTIGSTARDIYGESLPAPFSLTFTTTDQPPLLEFTSFSETLTLSSGRPPQVEIQARNISRLDYELYRLDLPMYFTALKEGGITFGDPVPRGVRLLQDSQLVPAAPNVNQVVSITLQDAPLPPGVYMLFVDTPDDDRGRMARMVIVRDIELVLKSSPGEAFVWAVNLSDGQPAGGVVITVLSESGASLATGQTDAQGIVTITGLPREDPFARIFVQTGDPAARPFGLTANSWSNGTQPYEFGIGLDFTPPEFRTYLYTERPIYRPGQTVFFRGVTRRISEGRYQLPEFAAVDATLISSRGDQVGALTLPLSDFGTFEGAFTLSPEAPLGPYSIETDHGRVWFDVAAFRKPEFTVAVEPSEGEVALGDPLTATIGADFFFGGPVPDAEVEWVVWADPTFSPDLPLPVDWFAFASGFNPFFGFESVASGSGVTGPDGRLEIEIPTEREEPRPVRYMIEATVTDLSGLQVTGRTEVNLHPADFYLVIIPERYALRAGETAVVGLQSLDWTRGPVSGREAQIRVERVTYEQVVEEGRVVWRPSAVLVNEAQLTTAGDGEVRFSFRPERAGTYRLQAEGRDAAGRRVLGSATIWVAGVEAGIWRQPAVGKLALVPDRPRYTPGETATILIPSPFAEPASALITVERDGVLTHLTQTVSGSDAAIDIPIELIHAPNVYVSVILIRPESAQAPAAMAFGLVELEVSAEAFELQLTLTPDRQTAGPGEAVSFSLEARDAESQPVQGEFSLALVDLAVLALAEPNTLPPFESLYGRQFLQVRTSASLSVSGEGGTPPPPADGVGGGGGGQAEPIEVRTEFPDTAYWNPSVITDEEGRAEVVVTVPDNLTTWRMDVRGTTVDARVGSASVDVVTTKPMFIRPVTPRFFTAGDEASVAAVVHNNTEQALSVEVRLSAAGARIESATSATVDVAAGGQARLEWELRVLAVDGVELTFFASGGEFEDASKATIGTAEDGRLPVLRYSSPDTRATSGVLAEAGSRLEVVNLPRRFDAEQGQLAVELDPSLGAALDSAVQSLADTPHRTTEILVSNFLPQLVLHRALLSLGRDDASLAGVELETTIRDALQNLTIRQNEDGGWGWWQGGDSDVYLTAYTVFGLALAEQAGFTTPERVRSQAIDFLRAGLVGPDQLTDPTQLDRQAFVLQALAEAGAGDLTLTRQMAAERQRLGIWARAVVAETLHQLAPDDGLIGALRSDLATAAIRSATGVHWEAGETDRRNLMTGVTATAHVLRALVALDPGEPLLADTVRWLLAARGSDGGWRSSHETAWAVLALAEWLEASGSLQSNFAYEVTLNGQALASGRAAPDAPFTSVALQQPLAELLPDQPNQLAIQRGEGQGALYYTAHLTVFRPIEDVPASSRGLSVRLDFFHDDGICDVGLENPCRRAESARVDDDLLGRVTLIVPAEQRHVRVEAPFPAGMEPVDARLETTPFDGPLPELLLADPLGSGWGWWFFSQSELRDDRLVLSAEFLPAGTYQFTFRLRAVFPGEYRVLPTRAWAIYFPEVFGQDAGRTYEISPRSEP